MGACRKTVAPRAVLCDLDGTLVDSRDGILRAFRHALAAEGLPAVPDDVVLATVGAPLPDAFARLTGRPELTERLRAHYRACYEGVCVSGSSLAPGVAETLPRLAERAGLAVVTTKGRHFPRKILDGHGVAHHFRVWVGADDVKNLKPHPEPVLLACDRLGVPPREAAMVGDTPYDVLAGRAAGAFTVGVLGGHSDEAALRAAGADAVVARFDEVPRALGW